VPAWSPTCSVTPDTLAWFAPLVPDELAVAALPAAEDDEDDEHAVSTARLAAAARASTRFVRFIIVLPY
jgi:hypothetical protein